MSSYGRPVVRNGYPGLYGISSSNVLVARPEFNRDRVVHCTRGSSARYAGCERRGTSVNGPSASAHVPYYRSPRRRTCVSTRG